MQVYRICSFIFFIFTTLNAQNIHTMKVSRFEWRVPTKGDYGAGEIDTYIEKHVEFVGDYKNEWECDYTFEWKCYPANQLYVLQNGTFVAIKNSNMFNDQQTALLAMINDSISNFCKLGKTGDCAECFSYSDSEKAVGFDELTIYFKDDGIIFSYSMGFGSFCHICNFSESFFSWEFLKPYLAKSITDSPNYCTPSGPKVNIRQEQSVSSTALFQLDQGSFFEIRSKGKADKVNGKDGFWYEIQYEGKQGYIFSFYTLCRL